MKVNGKYIDLNINGCSIIFRGTSIMKLINVPLTKIVLDFKTYLVRHRKLEVRNSAELFIIVERRTSHYSELCKQTTSKSAQKIKSGLEYCIQLKHFVIMSRKASIEIELDIANFRHLNFNQFVRLIKHYCTSHSYPASNGDVKRSVHTVKEA